MRPAERPSSGQLALRCPSAIRQEVGKIGTRGEGGSVAVRTGIYGSVSALSLLALGYWLYVPSAQSVSARVPIPENRPALGPSREGKDVNKGTLIVGAGKPSSEPGSWPQFRGKARDAVAAGAPLASSWPEEGPRVVWKIGVGEGHAGAAIHKGRVYLLDYDEERKEDVVRCLSLADGEEIWRHSYYAKVKRNHGMSRTVPAVNDDYVVTLGPKCHVRCLNPITGRLLWKKDLVAEYGARVPEWYAGQCPLMDGDRVVLAPGGSCLMTAVRLPTGEAVWEAPNDDGWRMTHSSVLPIDFEGRRQYVWCASRGAVGVDSETGRILWKLPGWRIKIANIPSPADAGGGRIFFSGGYGAGSMMVRLLREGGRVAVREVFRTTEDVFGSAQQTPVFYRGRIYGVIPGGRLACLAPEGKRLWVDETYNFGLGPYMIVDDKLLVLDDDPGVLYLFEVGPKGIRKLASHKVLEGYDAWGPIAFANGKVIVRDATMMVCLDLR